MAHGAYCANCGRRNGDGRRPGHCPDCGRAQGAGRRAVSDWRHLARFIAGPVSGLAVRARHRRAGRGSAPTRLAIAPAVTGAHAAAAATGYSTYGRRCDMVDGLLW